MNPNCIAVASMDRDYAGPMRVFIYSFKYYHPDIPINIYVLDDYTPDQDILMSSLFHLKQKNAINLLQTTLITSVKYHSSIIHTVQIR